MTVLAVILGVLLVATAGYLLVTLLQLRSITRQLARHVDDGERSAVTVALVVPQLEDVVARVNETVRGAQEASARTRLEERRFRSFIADVSHDVRTPLTTVRGYLQLLDRTELDESQRARLEVARRHAEELSALVERLYEYTYLLEVEPVLEAERLDVGVLAGECLLGMTTELERAGLEASYQPPAALMLSSDREKLTRILQNLLRNAVQHGRERVVLEVADTAGGAVLSVSNRLAAGTEVDAERLFDRFYTADRSRSGRTSGLGLSIVQVLTEQLGGTAEATVDGDRLTLRVTVPGLGGR